MRELAIFTVGLFGLLVSASILTIFAWMMTPTFAVNGSFIGGISVGVIAASCAIALAWATSEEI